MKKEIETVIQVHLTQLRAENGYFFLDYKVPV